MTDSFRIIGGIHRSRRLRFPPLPGIRPSPDRVRQTLFDWLAPAVVGAHCLDLYAGSGALGLEALSRGAASVDFVDREPAAVARIGEHLVTLGLPARRLVVGDARTELRGLPGPYDVVFLDPPYASDELGAVLELLLGRDGQLRLAPGARLYIERPASEGPPGLPPGLELLRSKRAGAVGYHLATFDADQAGWR